MASQRRYPALPAASSASDWPAASAPSANHETTHSFTDVFQASSLAQQDFSLDDGCAFEALFHQQNQHFDQQAEVSTTRAAHVQTDEPHTIASNPSIDTSFLRSGPSDSAYPSEGHFLGSLQSNQEFLNPPVYAATGQRTEHANPPIFVRQATNPWGSAEPQPGITSGSALSSPAEQSIGSFSHGPNSPNLLVFSPTSDTPEFPLDEELRPSAPASSPGTGRGAGRGRGRSGKSPRRDMGSRGSVREVDMSREQGSSPPRKKQRDDKGQGDSGPKFACPYFKNHRIKATSHSQACLGPGFPILGRLKEHLVGRVHYKNSDDGSPVTDVDPTRMTAVQAEQIRQIQTRSLSSGEEWYIFWDILFPGAQRPETPYVDTIGLDWTIKSVESKMKAKNYPPDVLRDIRKSFNETAVESGLLGRERLLPGSGTVSSATAAEVSYQPTNPEAFGSSSALEYMQMPIVTTGDPLTTADSYMISPAYQQTTDFYPSQHVDGERHSRWQD